ncbi:MAG: carboxypeptidase-like regulatory domain-containing protein, partial [Thermoplasmata archaeon]
IWGNYIDNTGANRPSGIMAEVPLWTQKGLWIHHLVIEWNTITDYSRYGIRLQQNVTQFNVAHNTIVNPSTHPGPWWTVVWGGPQIDAMYLIRGVNNGTVQDNYVDTSDTWYIATDGITLESDVSNVRLIHNVFYNVSQEGVVLQGNVPGFDNALPWQNGPSLYDTIANNLFDNARKVSETNFTVEAILLWHWANHTTVVNNTFIGWQNVPTKDYFNGAIVLTTASYGFYYNNTVEGARYGFVFTNFSGVAHPYSGEFNRSYNLVYGNHLSGITVAAVYETPKDGMGPLHNVIVVLSNASTTAGVPVSYVESIRSAQVLSITESGSTYTEVLRTSSPISGVVQNFTTWLAWSKTKFGISMDGGIGAGVLHLTPSSVSNASVAFSTSTTSSANATVSLDPTSGAYSAHYAVSRTVNGVTTNYSASAHGPLTVAISKGTTTLDVRLLSFTKIASAMYPLMGVVSSASTRAPVANATVSIGGGASVKTNAHGSYSFSLGNGTYTLQVAFTGYATAGATVGISGKAVVLNISLVTPTNRTPSLVLSHPLKVVIYRSEVYQPAAAAAPVVASNPVGTSALLGESPQVGTRPLNGTSSAIGTPASGGSPRAPPGALGAVGSSFGALLAVLFHRGPHDTGTGQHRP